LRIAEEAANVDARDSEYSGKKVRVRRSLRFSLIGTARTA
jgi:hypothetical protein